MRTQMYHLESKSTATRDEPMERRGDPFTEVKPKEHF